MRQNAKKITAAVLAVIFFLGVLPWFLSLIFEFTKPEDIKVRVLMTDGQIKSIALEDYLLGVVAAEMPAEFEREALKAQSVAARTYVLKRMEYSAKVGSSYDVDITERTQVWNSRQQMFKKWGVINFFKYINKIGKAVGETKGKILTYNGEKIDAVYHSSSGRKETERAADVWSGNAEYLTNVASGENETTRFVKRQTFEVADFYKLLGFTQIPKQFTADDIAVIERTKAGRIKSLAIRGKVFKGTDLRTKLGLPSTDFEWKIENKKIEVISYGKGHAVGMSQYGANDLAKAGSKYYEILAHFYPGTKIEKAY